jgi:hypothetical protein
MTEVPPVAHGAENCQMPNVDQPVPAGIRFECETCRRVWVRVDHPDMPPGRGGWALYTGTVPMETIKAIGRRVYD